MCACIRRSSFRRRDTKSSAATAENSAWAWVGSTRASSAARGIRSTSSSVSRGTQPPARSADTIRQILVETFRRNSMKLRVCLGTCAVLFASMVFAQEQPKMSAEEKAQMEAMMKAVSPSEGHKKLAAFVGTWDAKVKMYPMQPGAPVQESTGVSESKWVLGGRWVQETFNGMFMGMPFSGIGYTGYDNIKKQYVGTWMDTMSTSVMTSAGGPTSDKTYEFKSS